MPIGRTTMPYRAARCRRLDDALRAGGDRFGREPAGCPRATLRHGSDGCGSVGLLWRRAAVAAVAPVAAVAAAAAAKPSVRPTRADSAAIYVRSWPSTVCQCPCPTITSGSRVERVFHGRLAVLSCDPDGRRSPDRRRGPMRLCGRSAGHGSRCTRRANSREPYCAMATPARVIAAPDQLVDCHRPRR